ncbi:ceramide transfer protein-like [Rhopilema esculentum]|uniref:ceramide transfer protein-like n=1 Tax=Rhopilema esculentum TaxID=499914 RepID=UPI0031DF70B1
MAFNMVEELSLSCSDEEDDADSPRELRQEISLEGVLSKWTNYLHGWQDRYFILKSGNLSYYKSEFDMAYGCRGSVSLGRAKVLCHEYDDCRFDVHVNDNIYYLRSADPDERSKWISTLEAAKQAESGYGSETHLPKVASVLSLTSLPSLQSSSSFKRGDGLKEKLLEMETFRDILCRQIDTLQSYFDSCADKNPRFETQGLDLDDDDFDADDLSATPTPHDGNNYLQSHHLSRQAVDFRGEAITFKATTDGVLQVLSHCIELMSKREDQWKRRLEKERDRSKRLQEQYKEALDKLKVSSFVGGPDYEEGPYSKLNEEEFFDAVETALDREDEESELTSSTKERIPPPPDDSVFVELVKHRLSDEVTGKVRESLMLVKEDVTKDSSGWDMVLEDGDLKVYRKDFEVDGIVCDPLKASHIVQGVTGREMCHYFFDKDVRMDWDSTVEKCRVLEKLSDNTMVFHQVHKRVWPSSQRDTVFASHIRKLSLSEEGERLKNEIENAWMVTNWATDHDDAPANKYVRAVARVTMFCQTFVRPGVNTKTLNRENMFCKLTYTAQVNPGGWAPPSAVRAVSKREYPKFLRKFSGFVQEVTNGKQIMM